MCGLCEHGTRLCSIEVYKIHDRLTTANLSPSPRRMLSIVGSTYHICALFERNVSGYTHSILLSFQNGHWVGSPLRLLLSLRFGSYVLGRYASDPYIYDACSEAGRNQVYLISILMMQRVLETYFLLVS